MSWNLTISGHKDLADNQQRQAEALEVRKLTRQLLTKLKKHGLTYASFSGYDGSKNLMMPEEDVNAD